MRACYGRLHVQNVMDGHLWTPDKIKALTPNGDLYLQATLPLKNRTDEDKDELEDVSGISNEERDNMWESSKDTSDTSENTSMNEEAHACGYFTITVQSNQFASY